MAKKVNVHINLILAQIRTQHGKRMMKLKKQADSLKEYARKKGKRYWKALLKASAEKETIIVIANIPDKKGAVVTNPEILIEVFA